MRRPLTDSLSCAHADCDGHAASPGMFLHEACCALALAASEAKASIPTYNVRYTMISKYVGMPIDSKLENWDVSTKKYDTRITVTYYT